MKKFGLEISQSKRTLASTHSKLTKNCEAISVNHSVYQSMIGSLLYLTASQPNTVYAIRVCARYQFDPHASHLMAAKRILKYVSGTSNFGIHYLFDTTSSLVGYCDVDWTGCTDDRKSTSGGCFFLGNNLVSWFNKKQHSVSLSTTEA